MEKLQEKTCTVVSLHKQPPEVFLVTGVLKICSKFTGKHPCRSAISKQIFWNHTSAFLFSEYLFLRTPLSDCFCLFLINLQSEDLQHYLRDSSAGIFLWIMRIVQEHFFYRRDLGDFFCPFLSKTLDCLVITLNCINLLH